jgi:hypothetical protein
MTTATGRVRLDSTTLTAAAYDDSHARMELDFHDGTRYVYSGVPPNLYRDFLCAPSQGIFFNRHIRGRFPYTKRAPEN